jgi:hypothetical protein
VVHEAALDGGGADPIVTAALAKYAATGSAADALTGLSRSRVLVPVIAVPTGETPRAATQMATVLVTGRDGRRALLAFSGLDTLRRWRPDARPVPHPTATAARAAIAQDAAAIVLDVAGPVPFTVEGEDLRHLAAGLVLIDTGAGHAWGRPVTASGAATQAETGW